MARIHLIEKLGYISKVEENIFESGYWEVSLQTANELVGGDILFHKKQKEPSYFGGKIISYTVRGKDEEYPGRIIFRFEYSRAHKGVSAGIGGWSNEKKIVR